jgi:hypothetical protein
MYKNTFRKTNSEGFCLVGILPEVVVSNRQLLAADLGERISRQRLNKNKNFIMIKKKSSTRKAINKSCEQTSVFFGTR